MDDSRSCVCVHRGENLSAVSRMSGWDRPRLAPSLPCGRPTLPL